MAEESDGIEEALDGQIRVLVTAAGRMGEQFARAREEASRRAQAASEREARELSSRFDAERNAAHTEYANVYRNDWWDKATPEQIAGTYQTARAWVNEDPEAVRAEARIRNELATRHGIDPSQLPAPQARVQKEAVFYEYEFRNDRDTSRQISKADALKTVEFIPAGSELEPGERPGLGDVKDWVGKDYDVDRVIADKFPQLMNDEQRSAVEAETERRRGAAEHAEAARLLTEADRADSAAEEFRTAAQHEPDPDERQEARVQAETHQAHADSARADARPLYDSAERRQATAADLESKGISPEAVGAKMRADVSQAKPATEAAKGGPAKSPKARKTRSGRGAEAQRSGQSR